MTSEVPGEHTPAAAQPSRNLEASGQHSVARALQGLEPAVDSTSSKGHPAEEPAGALSQSSYAMVDHAPVNGVAATGSQPVGGSIEAESSSTGHGEMSDPQLDAETIHSLLHMMGPKVTARRFRADEITERPDLEAAARRELQQTDTQEEGKAMDKLHQQQAAAEAVDADAEDEGTVNQEVAELVVQRLEDGRRSMELLVRLLAGLVAAEAAYSTSLQNLARSVASATEPPSTAAQRQALSRSSSGAAPGPGQAATTARSAAAAAASAAHADDPVRPLVASLASLPETMAQAHRHLQGSLASLTADCQRLLDSLADACKRAAPEAARARSRVGAARAALADALATHAQAHRQMATVLSERDRGHAHRAPELDPWGTEGNLARAHRALQQAQDQERAFLKLEFRTMQQLEGQRLELTKQAVAVAAGSYRAALLPVQHDLVGLLDSVPNVDTTEKLQKLSRASSQAGELATQLAEQQSKSTERVCQDLFCSPEIIRQGGMQYLDTPVSRWTQGHFVLTRAGFLHWFRSVNDVEPLGCLNLSRCQFEAGTAYCFHVLELQPSGWLVASRQRRYSLQGPDVEDTCEWAVAIKEAIAVACGRSAHFEST